MVSCDVVWCAVVRATWKEREPETQTCFYLQFHCKKETLFNDNTT